MSFPIFLCMVSSWEAYSFPLGPHSISITISRPSIPQPRFPTEKAPHIPSSPLHTNFKLHFLSPATLFSGSCIVPACVTGCQAVLPALGTVRYGAQWPTLPFRDQASVSLLCMAAGLCGQSTNKMYLMLAYHGIPNLSTDEIGLQIQRRR